MYKNSQKAKSSDQPSLTDSTHSLSLHWNWTGNTQILDLFRFWSKKCFFLSTDQCKRPTLIWPSQPAAGCSSSTGLRPCRAQPGSVSSVCVSGPQRGADTQLSPSHTHPDTLQSSSLILATHVRAARLSSYCGSETMEQIPGTKSISGHVEFAVFSPLHVSLGRRGFFWNLILSGNHQGDLCFRPFSFLIGCVILSVSPTSLPHPRSLTAFPKFTLFICSFSRTDASLNVVVWQVSAVRFTLWEIIKPCLSDDNENNVMLMRKTRNQSSSLVVNTHFVECNQLKWIKMRNCFYCHE